MELGDYRMLGLPCVEVSARNGTGLDALRRALADGATLLVGRSGVGKSSLVNVLVPDTAAQTAELTREVEGRHTTTTARRYRLSPQSESQSAVMDAPGVRDFAPPATLARAAERGFVEIHERAADCRFNNCRHLGAAMRSTQCRARAPDFGTPLRELRRLYRLYEKLA